MNRDIMEETMGKNGFEFISDTLAHSGSFCAIQIVADTVFTALSPAPTGNTFTGVSMPTGTIIYGLFTTVTLTSGKVIAYKAV